MSYVAKCWKDFQNDDFTTEQLLYLFSYLISTGKAWTLDKEVRYFARNMIEMNWIDGYGKILVDPKEADLEF